MASGTVDSRATVTTLASITTAATFATSLLSSSWSSWSSAIVPEAGQPSVVVHREQQRAVVFGHELAMFMSWIPSETELAGLRVPVRTLAGRDHRGHYYHRAAEWLAKALGVDLVEIPGAHAPYLAHPREFAAALLPLLKGELERAM